MTCAACGSENRPGRKFCSSCGAPLARACPTCGAANEPEDRFCGECGSALEAGVARPAAPTAERRLVSVLFGDLVGFTPLSEDRDPEAVRELLSAYFDTARRVVERYGGTIEKFIGDAVMAVWGTPIAREDDAERAVRAGLELVDVVTALEAGIAMRVGVVTGEAAVTLGAEGEGMVAGDLVNTASRVQGAAEPGTVLVNERTRRASESAIAYEDAGEHELKGKSEAIPLWRAVRITAARGGERRASGLEPPFVGRDVELRRIKDLFHATAEERKARLVSVLGLAGIGKTRLSWELEKYLDGLAGDVYWHRGRCLAYGEGVAYWALAEMVRMRTGIAEGEDSAEASRKLHAAAERYLLDPDERAWVEPKLAQLLGLADEGAADRQNLYAGWRLFFERLAEQSPTVLVFEDLQWADAALLEFVDYLLDWSRNHPIYVLTLARPEFGDRVSWGAAQRDFTSISLEPLGDAAMDELLEGLVPGLPAELRARVRERAEGVPLYAVETVRMLLDRNLVQRDGDGYVAAADVESLEVPETLHALIAARLDDLVPAERRAIEDAAVLGKTFTAAGLAALTGMAEDELQPILASLVRKDLLMLQADPRSPERGNYGFLQALVQRIAHDTLSRKERKTRHLAVARHLERHWTADETEIVEVIASHYLDAYRADPEADDAAEIRKAARDALARAGRRAASVAANEEAQRYFEQAAELTEEPARQAELLEQAGILAEADGRNEESLELLERAIALWEQEGLTHPAARGEARLAMARWNVGQIDTAAERLSAAFEVLSRDEPDADIAMLAGQLARFRIFVDDVAGAREPLEFALETSESLVVPHVLSDALNTKALIMSSSGRPYEAAALMRGALDVALKNDLTEPALRAYFNLAYLEAASDRLEAAVAVDEQGLELARRRGSRQWEENFKGHLRTNAYFLGNWDRIEAAPMEELRDKGWDGLIWSVRLDFAAILIPIHVARGRLDEAREIAALVPAEPRAEVQEVASIAVGRAALARAEGRHEDALAEAETACSLRGTVGPDHPAFKVGIGEALSAALALDDLDKVQELLDRLRGLPPSQRAPFVEAQLARFEARLAERRGDTEGIPARFGDAAAILRRIGTRFWLGQVLLEHAEWLSGDGRADDARALVEEAREIFERLEARPWLERLDAVATPVSA